MTLFSTTETASQPRKKAPTSYQYYSGRHKGRKNSTPAVEAIFLPSEKIRSYGFMCGEVLRFNIYHDDPRFEDCASLVARIIEENLFIRVSYSKDDRGLATLIVDPKKKGDWEDKSGWYKQNAE